MAKLRKSVSYRRLERPYTRRSKYREKSFIRGNPANRIVSFDIGNLKRKFGYTVHLISKQNIQVRDNAIESGRTCSNRALEGQLGKSGFYMKIRMHPHHILRENPLAAGAGADRMSTGMKASFGKPMSNACQIKQGKILVSVSVHKRNLDVAKSALKKFAGKLPVSTTMETVENPKEEKVETKKSA
tara:strand:- start:442 stop:999 length:558 start_codon:yes stop_codon:yes gene_type:complete